MYSDPILVSKYEMQPCSTALQEMCCSDFILAMKIFLMRLYIPSMHINLVGGSALFYGVEKNPHLFWVSVR